MKVEPGFFKLKNLCLKNRESAFKINTDGVILAAWADLAHAESVLEVGTGTGIIACILATRFSGLSIMAIDIDEASIEEARFNFKSNKLKCINSRLISLQDLAKEQGHVFDGIVLNPPFHDDAYLPSDRNRIISKHTYHLSPADLAESCCGLLSGSQSFVHLVWPYDRLDQIRLPMLRNGFYERRIMYVKSRAEKAFNRCFIQFNREDGDLSEEEMILFTDAKRTRTRKYQDLVGEIYL